MRCSDSVGPTRGPTNHQKPGFPQQKTWFVYVKTFVFHGFEGHLIGPSLRSQVASACCKTGQGFFSHTESKSNQKLSKPFSARRRAMRIEVDEVDVDVGGRVQPAGFRRPRTPGIG